MIIIIITIIIIIIIIIRYYYFFFAEGRGRFFKNNFFFVLLLIKLQILRTFSSFLNHKFCIPQILGPFSLQSSTFVFFYVRVNAALVLYYVKICMTEAKYQHFPL